MLENGCSAPCCCVMARRLTSALHTCRRGWPGLALGCQALCTGIELPLHITTVPSTSHRPAAAAHHMPCASQVVAPLKTAPCSDSFLCRSPTCCCWTSRHSAWALPCVSALAAAAAAAAAAHALPACPLTPASDPSCCAGALPSCHHDGSGLPVTPPCFF